MPILIGIIVCVFLIILRELEKSDTRRILDKAKDMSFINKELESIQRKQQSNRGLSMSPEEYKRQDIEVLNEVRPYCFESDREEQWFKVGLQYGLDAADAEPLSRWISVKEKLPCNEKDLVIEFIKEVELRTKKVVVLLEDGFIDITYMYSFPTHGWHWNINDVITHWFPIPELPKE